jgi:hypothetical protein
VTSGSTVANTTTASDGSYTFTGLDAGHYTAEVGGDSYTTAFFTVICLGGVSTPDQDATITPELSADETRIILTWGSTPTDLDSHLTGSLYSGTAFHTYFVNKIIGTDGTDRVELDLDDMTSYGPETTTIYDQVDGVYRYSVHDFTNRSSTSSDALSNSQAQVIVYRGGEIAATFNVPTNEEGTLWTVFELDGDTITPINTMSYESDYESIQ